MKASDRLKKSVFKDLKSPKERTLGRSKSSKSTSSKSSGKLKMKKKKSKKDLVAVADYIEKSRDFEDTSDHTHTTRMSDSTASTIQSFTIQSFTPPKPSSSKSSKRNKKSIERSSSSRSTSSNRSKKGDKKGEKTKSKEESNSAVPPPPPPSQPTTPGRSRGRLLSFDSMHGKSFHKPSTRRVRGNAESALSPIPPSPQPVHATLVSPQSGGTKRKSILQAKKEQQMLKQKQEREEQEKKAKDKNKNDNCINEILDIVHSNFASKAKTPPVSVNPYYEPVIRTGNFVEVDPDEMSQSTCSVVSEGSYEKDDLLSNASERSEEHKFKLMDSLLGSEDEQEFGEHSFTFDPDHELSPTKVSPTKLVLDQLSGSNGQDGTKIDEESFRDTLTETLASSMSALQEVDDELESPRPPPKPSTSRTVPMKSLLKTSSSKGCLKAPLRLVPKRAKSDITSLSSLKNSIRVRLPGQRKPITRQRTLSFNEKVRVKRVPCQAQVCEGENSELWFQPQEYEAIKRKTMALIRAVQDDQTGGVTYCTRGLERYFAVDAVQDKRNDAWDSVLDEQEAQRANCETFNADRLSRVYAETTRESMKEAVERGKLDEDAIFRYTKKMRQTLRRTYSMPI